MSKSKLYDCLQSKRVNITSRILVRGQLFQTTDNEMLYLRGGECVSRGAEDCWFKGDGRLLACC